MNIELEIGQSLFLVENLLYQETTTSLLAHPNVVGGGAVLFVWVNQFILLFDHERMGFILIFTALIIIPARMSFFQD